ncbi:MAG: PilZ domain-containing protein [Thermoanaerobaculia bacterium]
METPRKKAAAASENPEQQVVVAGRAGEAVDMLLPMLRKHSVQYHRIPGGEAVIEAIVEMPLVDLVLIAYPLPDMTFREFMESVNTKVPPVRPPQVVVIITKEDAKDVAGFVNQGVQVLPAHLQPAHLERLVSKYLRKAPRPAIRIMVGMGVNLGVGKILRMAQAANVSTSGMLIRTNEDFPLGSSISLEFTLPGEQEPIKVEATVVRHTDPDREQIKGLGLKFVDIAPGPKKRLEDYLQRKVLRVDD